MTTWREVVAAHDEHPNWSSVQIAEHLGCTPEYVRATAQRKGLRIERGPGELSATPLTLSGQRSGDRR